MNAADSNPPFKRPNAPPKTLADSVLKIYRALFGRKCFSAWNRFLCELGWRGLGILDTEDIHQSGETRFLKRYLNGRGEFILVDAGARKGQYSRRAKECLPQARILALEPDPAVFLLLKKDAEKYGYQAIQKGLSSREGVLTLYDMAGSPHLGTAYATVHKEAFEQIYKTPSRSQGVEMTTVDQLMKEFGLAKIDLLKLDIEGHEYSALEGAKKALAENRIDCIQFEFEEINAILKIFLRDFAALLPGFSFHRILPSGELLPLDLSAVKISEVFALQNIIALRQK